jgi:hypothetical protein
MIPKAPSFGAFSLFRSEPFDLPLAVAIISEPCPSDRPRPSAGAYQELAASWSADCWLLSVSPLDCG